MPGRRDILQHAAALGVGSALLPAWASASAPRGAPIRGIVRRDDTIRRLGGIGDGYKLSWAADGRHYVVVNDGPGWADPPTTFYGSRLWTIDGPANAARFAEVAGYPVMDRAARGENAPSYYGHGTLAVGDRIYQFLSTLDRATDRPRRWTGTKLIWSADGGRSWRNQDGSSPVVWEDWADQSRRRFAFFDEPGGCFALLSIVQMGSGYRANRDGFVYLYGLNGSVGGRMNELVLARVAIAAIADRRAYRFFAGHGPGGSARWSAAIADRAVVHRFPPGWVNATNLFPGDLVIEAWLPSVVYNEPLGLYMMASAGVGCAPDGTEFGKPGYLGFWVADRPWGPWRQVHADAAWTPGGDAASRAYAPQIAPGWIAPDGRSLWIMWADLAGIRAFGRDGALLEAALARAPTPHARTMVETDFIRRYMPRFACNVQRIDLV
jgi:hypothetical protein